MSIDGNQSPDLDLAVGLSEFFYVDKVQAKADVNEIQQIINKNCGKIALQNKISQKEINVALESLGIENHKTKK
ncbi:hypothetical protein [Abyssogena phaseoliformis symbiont]|uniref:hypothetical protein n=1 Tax=Abyssogena phaseoliformis symbiont TaxID=596095 RepID=UPI001915DCBC|nr:hypothetical protein [Abyssogena phaseoliformis symbiont]MBW5288872.1 hypothetical protein [Candidatus Ruthia sp. Apha_13_S6]